MDSNGIVAYAGPSNLDGKPIVLIPTGFVTPSTNPKTGPMIQGWIIRSDVPPTDAAKNGEDYSICGNCPLRTKFNVKGKQERKCYVNPFQAPQNVYRAFKSGQYPEVKLEEAAQLLKRRELRLGAYGDPAAVPYEVLKALVKLTRNHTGYTHQWKTCDPRLKQIVMASCDSKSQAEEARAMGWRTFRIIPTLTSPRLPGEILCPATPEAGERTQCIRCGLCDGRHEYLRNGSKQADPRKNIIVVAHGKGASLFRLKNT